MRSNARNAPLKVGIIGANWGLLGHLPAWRALPGVEVIAICAAHQETAEKAAREHGITYAYWDYHEMLASPEIDIIDVSPGRNCATRW